MKSLFVVPQLSHGGSNKSLESILSILGATNRSISVISLEIDECNSPYYVRFSDSLLTHSLLYSIVVGNIFIRKILNALQNYLKINVWQYVYTHDAKVIQRKYRFDMVIGFEESYATLYTSYFTDCKKIAWMHCDYNLYKVYSGGRDEHELYYKFDKVIAVSKFAKQVFCSNFPELIDKVDVIYNLIDVNKVRTLSQEPVDDVRFDSSSFTLVSVGRITEVKQFQLIPHFVKKLLEINKDLSFKWYLIGDGDSSLKNAITQKIEEYKLQEYIILLGAKDNPYPYIKNSSLLVSTSRTESWSYVINEAKTLHTPVLTIRCGSSEEVVDEHTGVIVDSNQFVEALYDLISDSSQYNNLKELAMKFEYDNKSIMDQLKYMILH